jgi:hypothetical protein
VNNFSAIWCTREYLQSVPTRKASILNPNSAVELSCSLNYILDKTKITKKNADNIAAHYFFFVFLRLVYLSLIIKFVHATI